MSNAGSTPSVYRAYSSKYYDTTELKELFLAGQNALKCIDFIIKFRKFSWTVYPIDPILGTGYSAPSSDRAPQPPL